MKVPIIGVETWLNDWEKSAEVDIAQSTIASLTTQEIMDLDGEGGKTFYEELAATKQNYGWIEGSPEFKAEVAKLYEKELDPDCILQTNGATGANMNALDVIVNPGDHVIAEYPTYDPLYNIPAMRGAEVEYWHLHEEDGWQPRIEELEALVRPDTKLICLNNASNPLGSVLSRDMLEKIADIARKVGAYVVCDEVYLPLEDTESYASIVDVYEKGIATNSLSKTYSVPGIRIGWVATHDKDIADQIRYYRDYSMICGGVYNDLMAVHVLRHRDKILARNREIVFKNREIVQEWIEKEPRASWIPPRGISASYIRLDIPMDDEEFCLKVLKERGLLLVPGSRFNLPRGARLGYCAPEETLREGLTLLHEALAEFDA